MSTDYFMRSPTNTWSFAHMHRICSCLKEGKSSHLQDAAAAYLLRGEFCENSICPRTAPYTCASENSKYGKERRKKRKEYFFSHLGDWNWLNVRWLWPFTWNNVCSPIPIRHGGFFAFFWLKIRLRHWINSTFFRQDHMNRELDYRMVLF